MIHLNDVERDHTFEHAESVNTIAQEWYSRCGVGVHLQMRSGITLLKDVLGNGSLLERQHSYRIRVRMWLNKGEAVRWDRPWGAIGHAILENEGHTLTTDVRFDRVFLISGLFYGVEGMRVGGTRKLKISPHLGYGDKGVPGVIPPNAVLIAEITFVEERDP